MILVLTVRTVAVAVVILRKVDLRALAKLASADPAARNLLRKYRAKKRTAADAKLARKLRNEAKETRRRGRNAPNIPEDFG